MVVGVQTAKANSIHDLNHDGIVDMRDIGRVAGCFGSHHGGPRWDPESDFDLDGRVNMWDIGCIGRQFGCHCPHLVVPELPVGPILGLVGCFAAFGVFGLVRLDKHSWRFSKR